MLQTVFTLDLWEVEVPLACRRLPTDNGALEIERQKRVISGLAPNRTKPSGVPIVPAGTKINSATATASAIRPSNVFCIQILQWLSHSGSRKAAGRRGRFCSPSSILSLG
jgi:hypothetical protein